MLIAVTFTDIKSHGRGFGPLIFDWIALAAL